MPTVDQILNKMGKDISVTLRAPHYVVDHNSPFGIYYHKNLAPKEVAEAIINLCEQGVPKGSKEKLSNSTTDYITKIKHLEKQNGDLMMNNVSLEKEVEKQKIIIEAWKNKRIKQDEDKKELYTESNEKKSKNIFKKLKLK